MQKSFSGKLWCPPGGPCPQSSGRQPPTPTPSTSSSVTSREPRPQLPGREHWAVTTSWGLASELMETSQQTGEVGPRFLKAPLLFPCYASLPTSRPGLFLSSLSQPSPDSKISVLSLGKPQGPVGFHPPFIYTLYSPATLSLLNSFPNQGLCACLLLPLPEHHSPRSCHSWPVLPASATRCPLTGQPVTVLATPLHRLQVLSSSWFVSLRGGMSPQGRGCVCLRPCPEPSTVQAYTKYPINTLT